jgi:hypothetical protein
MARRRLEHRLTINLPLDLWQKLDDLARATRLNQGACARMLIVEALAVRDLHPKLMPPPRNAREPDALPPPPRRGPQARKPPRKP